MQAAVGGGLIGDRHDFQICQGHLQEVRNRNRHNLRGDREAFRENPVHQHKLHRYQAGVEVAGAEAGSQKRLRGDGGGYHQQV